MSYQGITFGTDGWRAVIADGFTVKRVRIVGQAVADWLASIGRSGQKVLVGYDGRFGGEMFALAAGKVLAGNGFQVDVTRKLVPTPAVSWRIPRGGYAAGLMVTASHNPPSYSGIKVKPHFGGSPDESVMGPIEGLLGANTPRDGEVTSRVDFTGEYMAMLRGMVNLKFLRRLKGTIVFDPMGGVQAGNLAVALKGLPARLVEIHGTPDPMFCGLHAPEPIGANLKELEARVKKERALIGIANDGDGDRVGIVDDKGRFITPHIIFALLLLLMVRYRKQTGGVVKTVSGSFLIERIARAHRLPLEETPVGFKYICRLMREKDILIGGEESGGIGFKGYIPERDGLLAGLMMLELLARSGKKLSQLISELSREFGVSNYGRIDVKHHGAQEVLKMLREEPPRDIAHEKVERVGLQDGLKLTLADGSWLLFRASGTEPLLRIYAESPVATRVKRLLESGAILAGADRQG